MVQYHFFPYNNLNLSKMISYVRVKKTATHTNFESNQEPFDCMTAKTCTEPRDFSILYKKAIFLTNVFFWNLLWQHFPAFHVLARNPLHVYKGQCLRQHCSFSQWKATSKERYCKICSKFSFYPYKVFALIHKHGLNSH